MSRSYKRVLGYVDSNPHAKRLSNRKFRGNVKPRLQDVEDLSECAELYNYDPELGYEAAYDFDNSDRTATMRYTIDRQAHRKIPQALCSYDICNYRSLTFNTLEAKEMFESWYDMGFGKGFKIKDSYITKQLARLRSK